jgi:hypothetical protein
VASGRGARGQRLPVIEGLGRAQARGGGVITVRPGHSVYTLPGELQCLARHPHNFISHVAIREAPASGARAPGRCRTSRASSSAEPRRMSSTPCNGPQAGPLARLLGLPADGARPRRSQKRGRLTVQRSKAVVKTSSSCVAGVRSYLWTSSTRSPSGTGCWPPRPHSAEARGLAPSEHQT